MWNEAMTLSPITARLEKTKIDQIQKDLVPFPPMLCILDSLSLSCVSLHSSLLKKPKSGQEDIQVWDIWFQQPLPTQRARNTKRRSTPPPVVSSTSRVFHTGSLQLWVHLTINIFFCSTTQRPTWASLMLRSAGHGIFSGAMIHQINRTF